MQQQADNARRSNRLPAPEERGRGRTLLLAVLVIAFLAVLWKGEAWLGPKAPPPQTTMQLETALRTGMYLQAERIKAFRIRTGHLPDSLAEAGPPAPGVSYSKLDDHTYEITGQNGTVTLRYRSDQPMAQLIGDAASRLGFEE